MDKNSYSGKYSVKNPFLLCYLRSIDFILTLFKKFSKKPLKKTSSKVSRILVSNIAHMGDCVLSTSVLPIIREKFPDAKIGFLVGEWNKTLLKDHPVIEWLHFFNHPLIDRQKGSRIKKLYRFLVSFKGVITEINKVKYDIAIDLQPFYPNSIFFLYCTNIPRRVGYKSAGFSPLLTDGYNWKHQGCHITSTYFELLKPLDIHKKEVRTLRGFLPHFQTFYSSSKDKASECKSYVVFHPFSGSYKKDWKIEKWQELVTMFQDKNYNVIFTGKGKSHKEILDKNLRFNENSVNLCDKLSIEEFSKVIRGSKLVVTVDTFTVHLSAVFDVPVISLHSGFANAKQWGPGSFHSKALYEKIGGAQEISAERVYLESVELLSRTL